MLLTLYKALFGLFLLYVTLLYQYYLKTMKMYKKLILVLILLFIIDIAIAATIHGTVYNLDLEKQQDTIISINSTPKQTFVSKDGTYSFDLPAGTYELKAEYNEESAIEEITIQQEGTYILDLILFPEFVEQELLGETEEEYAIDEYFQKPTPLIYYFIIIIIIAGVAVLMVYVIKRMKKTLKEFKKELTGIEEDEANKIYEFIKKHKRVLQKQIRKKFPSSEAKISLILSELEHKGKIEKIKKGRGNLIILKK